MRLRLFTILPLAACFALSAPACSKKKDDEKSDKKKSKGDDDDKPKKKPSDKDGDKDDDKPKKKPSDKDGDKDDKKPSVGCELPEGIINKDLSLPKNCKLTIKSGIVIDEGATLTLAEGAKLSFEAGGTLLVSYGRIVAKGTEDAPVVFTSANKSPGPGDWDGIIFAAKTMAGNILDHVVVEYAGKGSFDMGGIGVNFEQDGRLSITNSTIRKNANAGITNGYSDAGFGKFENNTFSANGVSTAPTSLKLDANVFGSVGKGNKFGDPIRIHGRIKKSQTWPDLDVPVILTEQVSISGLGSAAIVKIPNKATIKFTADASFVMGGEDGGGLQAKDVLFTSANATAAAGDWVGLVFLDKSVNTEIDGCTIEYAGKGGPYGNGAVHFVKEAKELKGVKITNTIFRKNKDFTVLSEGDCAHIGDPKSGNKSEGLPLCGKE